MTRLLALYPRWWRKRYGEEMRALLDDAPARSLDRVDLVRGAFDAWLHPPVPSHAPGLAALLGGGSWTVAAAGVIAQPVPPDWPGYLIEIIPLAVVSVAAMLIAVLGIALRMGADMGRSIGLVVGLAVIGYLGWIVALAGTAVAAVDGATLGAAATFATVATVAIGAIVTRAGDELVGLLILLAASAMLVPWAGAWLVAGACWTAIGMVLIVEVTLARRATGDPVGRRHTLRRG